MQKGQAELDSYLSTALKKLEKAQEEILKTQTYNDEVERLQILKELIKEQVKNENSGHTAR